MVAAQGGVTPAPARAGWRDWVLFAAAGLLWLALRLLVLLLFLAPVAGLARLALAAIG